MPDQTTPFEAVEEAVAERLTSALPTGTKVQTAFEGEEDDIAKLTPSAGNSLVLVYATGADIRTPPVLPPSPNTAPSILPPVSAQLVVGVVVACRNLRARGKQPHQGVYRTAWEAMKALAGVNRTQVAPIQIDGYMPVRLRLYAISNIRKIKGEKVYLQEIGFFTDDITL